MKTFSIFKHPDNRLQAVKQGFSFAGLLGGGLWLLWHRTWFLGVLITVVSFGVYFVFQNPEGHGYGISYGYQFGLADVINLGICGVVGFLGNDWRASSLVDRGFDNVGTEQAATPDGAKAAYLRRFMDATREPAFKQREPF